MAVPERRVANAEIAARLGIDEAWIAKRTGTAVPSLGSSPASA